MTSLHTPITIEIDPAQYGIDGDVAAPVRDAVIAAAASQGFTGGVIGVLVTDDATIHEINREHLQHDYPTDVISFAYGVDGTRVEGELVVSLETAQREAAELGWTILNELLLYVVHGTLHIGGLDDRSESARCEMRRAEQLVLQSLSIDDASRFSPDAHWADVSGGCEFHSPPNSK